MFSLFSQSKTQFFPAFTALILLALAAQAQAATGVSVDVSRVELSTAAGGSLNHAVTVNNPGKQGDPALAVNAYLSDFNFPLSGDAKFLPAGSTKNSLARWFQFTPPNFTLQAGQDQQVRYTIQVPAGTAAGLYWGVLFFKSETPGEKPGASAPTNSGVSMKYHVDVGQIIYVQVGTPKLDAQLSELGVSYSSGELIVNATVKNAGTALIRAAGRAVVVDNAGKAVATVPIDESVALPSYSRTFTGKTALDLPPGQYQVVMALQYADNKRFTAQKELVVQK